MKIRENAIENMEDSLGRFFSQDKYKIIYLRNKDLSTLAHELIHFTTFVLEDRGVELSDDNTEVFAYYYEMMFSKVLKIWQK